MLNNKKNIVLSIYVIVLTIVGPLIFWLSSHQAKVSSETKLSQNLEALPNKAESPTKLPQKSISLGDKILIAADTNPDKQAGTEALVAGNFSGAIEKFKSSLQTNRNDPETLIYLNNALALSKGDVIKIGVSVPIGGNLNVAKEILRGVAQAQEEVDRQGGINGKLVLVEIANDNNDPETAKQIATEFVKDASVLAIVGHNSSDASLAAAPIYQQGGIVMISPTSVAKNLPDIGDRIFRTTPSTRFIADELANYTIKTARKTKIAICADPKSQASASFKEEFAIAMFEHGGTISKIPCDFSAPTFNAETIPAQAIGDGVDALLLAPSIDKLNPALEVARANQGRLTLLGSQAMYVYETLKEGQGDTKGTVMSVVWHPAVSAKSTFASEAQKLWGGAGSWRTATAYDAAKVILTGLNAGSTRKQLQKAISDPNFSVVGATGTVEFLPSGDRNMKGILVKVEPGKVSGTGFDFVPLLSKK